MKKILIIGFVILSLLFVWSVVWAASVGPSSPGTMADDATVGTATWGTTDNAKVSDNTYSTVALFCGSSVVSENSIKIVKGGSITGTEKSTAAALTTSDAYVSYGGASDLWGTTWTPDDINASTFGVVFSTKQSGVISHYLEATNFNFAIPAGATIDGILVEVEQKYAGSAPC